MVNNNSFNQNGAIAPAIMGDPNAYQRAVQSEDRILNRGMKGHGEPPPPEKGDRYILIAAFFGIIIGGAIGFVLAMYVFGKPAIFLSSLAGIIIGGLIGTYAGSYLKNRSLSNDDFNNQNPVM